jgi:hypothetical protein
LLICKQIPKSNREITITAAETQFSSFIRTPSETMTYLLETATEATRASTKIYIAGLEAIAEQQQLAQQASLEWISELISAQSNVSKELAESHGSVKGELTDVAEEATRLASRAGSEVLDRSRDAAVSASKKQRQTVTKATRPHTATTSESASSGASQPGPARWTGEAYESMTAAEINEKLPQLPQRELREVETYEKAHQSRQTVLDRISALHGQQPVPGYDELNVQEIQKLLTEGDDKLSASVRDYERPRKSREGVLQAADAKLSKS